MCLTLCFVNEARAKLCYLPEGGRGTFPPRIYFHDDLCMFLKCFLLEHSQHVIKICAGCYSAPLSQEISVVAWFQSIKGAISCVLLTYFQLRN